MKDRYVIQLPGGFVGRMTLTAPLGPVDFPFASIFDDLEDAELIADQFEGATVLDRDHADCLLR